MREPYSDTLYGGRVLAGTPQSFLYPDAASRFVIRRATFYAVGLEVGATCLVVYSPPGGSGTPRTIAQGACSASVADERNPGFYVEQLFYAIEYDGLVALSCAGSDFDVTLGGYRLEYPT
jgi:hypothetical protein